MRLRLIIGFGLLALILVSCRSAQSSEASAGSNPEDVVSSSSSAATLVWSREAKLDQQGAVSVEVIPITFDESQELLTFKVALNTHSVNLDMDLARLAVLETDSGHVVEAIGWDAPRGGHHVQGTLIFPGVHEGQHVLHGAMVATLRLKDVDAPERVFTWRRVGSS